MLSNQDRRRLLKQHTEPNPLPRLPRLPLPIALISWLSVAALVPIAVPFLVFGMVLYKALYTRTNRY